MSEYWRIQWGIAVADELERRALALGDASAANDAAAMQLELLERQAQIRKQMGARHA